MSEAPADQPFGGVVFESQGARFLLRSRNATRVELCLFEPSDTDTNTVEASQRCHEVRRIELERRHDELFEVLVPGVEHGQLYGYRVHGPWQPQLGHRFDARKLLVDPCASALRGRLELDASVFGLPDPDRPEAAPHPGFPPGLDSASSVPLSIAIDPDHAGGFDWQQDPSPAPELRRQVFGGWIYEAHVRGMTKLHPRVPPELRGTYLGMAHPAILEHLTSLGVSAVELMPIQNSASEPHLVRKGLRNYWGYSPLALCAPDARFATRDDSSQVDELKTLVRELHKAGIAVLLDVVLNHTIEGGAFGPILSLRGIDNQTYYRHEPSPKQTHSGRLLDFTGCGNTLDFSDPMVVDLALHSLRVWARDYRVDGFRFDLAPVLGRGEADFDPEHRFFRELQRDPALRHLTFIAEPWDLGPDGYSLGRFPAGWGEWNDQFRQTMRRLWRGDGVSSFELGARLSGSRDIFRARQGSASQRQGSSSHSIDYVTSHDGFTLADLVSYEHKHNLANAEHNRDGSDHNQSRNWGVEGPSADPAVISRRRKAQRGLLSMLMLSQATPMLLHGDELGRSQKGNNNAYCQDNEVSWIDWNLGREAQSQLEFTRRLFATRQRLQELLGADPWVEVLDDPRARDHEEPERLLYSAVVHLRSQNAPHDQALVLINTREQPATLELPAAPAGRSWQIVLANTERSTSSGGQEPAIGRETELEPMALLVLVARGELPR